jgi:hypothetical protein
MSLQDDVNAQIEGIQSSLADAGAVLPVEQSFTVMIDFGPTRTALTEAANAIDALLGDSSVLRSAIEGIEDQEQEVVIPLGGQNAAIGSTVSAANGMVSLLITQSNFDGASQ